jgi:hypothetical protein
MLLKLKFLMLLISFLTPWISRSAETTNTHVSASITIPIHWSHGRIMLSAKVNGSKPLSFLLDTGYGVTTIHPDLVESLRLNRAGRMTIVGIAGEEQAATYSDAVFDFGRISYKPRRVASLPSEADMPTSRRAGILGAGFFRRFVVEIDSEKNILRLHEPQLAFSGASLWKLIRRKTFFGFTNRKILITPPMAKSSLLNLTRTRQ